MTITQMGDNAIFFFVYGSIYDGQVYSMKIELLRNTSVADDVIGFVK
ncbi:MAG: hypothetical protein ACJ71K_22205 [Nitrososphaeraceae archaeon]|jgi:hypothetical protein